MNIVKREHFFPSGQRLEIVHGDITAETVDAIVNAANERLAHGGGVAGVISRRGGPEIQRESSAWVRAHGPVPHERPAYTGAGKLPCRYVLHAVGPVWGSGGEDAKLDAAVRGSLERAAELELESIALPAISTGIFGFPKKRAAEIFYKTIAEFYSANPATCLHIVRLVMFDQPTLDVFLAAYEEWEHR